MYRDETVRDILQELHLPQELLTQVLGPDARLRLEAAYFTPLLAARFADSLVTGDICLMSESCEQGSSEVDALIDGSAALGLLGQQSAIKARREAQCADVVRRCGAALLDLPGGACCGHVFVPWGMYHADGIAERLLGDKSVFQVHDTSCLGPRASLSIPYGLTLAVIAAIATR